MRLSRLARWAVGPIGAGLILTVLAEPLRGQSVLELDQPPETDKPITDTLSYGLELGLDALRAEHLDLERPGIDAISLEPTLNLALTWLPDLPVRAFVDLEFGYLYERLAGAGSRSPSVRAKEAYATLGAPGSGVALQGGRLPFEDPLRWLYDEELDGARAIWRLGDAALDASISRLHGVDLDALEDEPGDGGTNLFLLAHHPLAEQLSGSTYVLYRDDLEGEETLTFLGVQASGGLNGFDLRFDAAWVAGEARSEDGWRDISGVGADLAVTSRFDLPFAPSLTFGLAFGSGDGGEVGDDGAFRQTSLHGNEVSFGGLTRIATYGEVVSPELSNLWVWTVGGGLRPSATSSIDLIWHWFRQDEPADDLRDSRLEVAPLGEERDLGEEIDLVLAYAGIEDLEAELTVGAFFPGRAFAEGSTAWLVALELVLEF